MHLHDFDFCAGAYSICVVWPKCIRQIAPTPELPAARQTCIWATRASDENRSARAGRYRYDPLLSRFLVSASAVHPATHPRTALGLAVLAATKSIQLRRAAATRTRRAALLFGAKSRGFSGTSQVPRVSVPAARPAVHSRSALDHALLAAIEGIHLRCWCGAAAT